MRWDLSSYFSNKTRLYVIWTEGAYSAEEDGERQHNGGPDVIRLFVNNQHIGILPRNWLFA